MSPSDIIKAIARFPTWIGVYCYLAAVLVITLAPTIQIIWDISYASLGVSLATIHRAEAVDRKTVMTLANASAVRRAFENAGVELIEENGGGPGETSRWLK